MAHCDGKVPLIFALLFKFKDTKLVSRANEAGSPPVGNPKVPVATFIKPAVVKGLCRAILVRVVRRAYSCGRVPEVPSWYSVIEVRRVRMEAYSVGSEPDILEQVWTRRNTRLVAVWNGTMGKVPEMAKLYIE